MLRKVTTVLITVAVVAAAPTAAMALPAGQTADDPETPNKVTVKNAQVDTLQLENSTINNVTIQVLRIDQLTVRNQTGVEDLNETLGGENGTVVLRNVTFDTLTLGNASAEGLSVGEDNQTDVGNVSRVTIQQMAVDEVTIGQLDVTERRGGGGVIGGLIDFISGLFDGDGQDQGNNTTAQNDTGGVAENDTTAQNDTDGVAENDTDGFGDNVTVGQEGQRLVVQNVSVQDLTISEMSVDTLVTEQADAGQAQQGNETGDGVGVNDTGNDTGLNETDGDVGPTENASVTVIENVTVESATIGSLNVQRLTVQAATQQAGQPGNQTNQTGANDTDGVGADGNDTGGVGADGNDTGGAGADGNGSDGVGIGTNDTQEALT